MINYFYKINGLNYSIIYFSPSEEDSKNEYGGSFGITNISEQYTHHRLIKNNQLTNYWAHEQTPCETDLVLPQATIDFLNKLLKMKSFL